MTQQGMGREIADSALERVRILVNILLDLALLAAWFYLLSLFDLIFKGKGHDGGPWDYQAGKSLFAISLLAAIVLFIYWDTRTINRRLRAKFNTEGGVEKG